MILFFSNSQVWSSIVDPDKIASEGGEPDHSLHSKVFCHSVCRHYFMAKPYCSDFKIITAIVQASKFFRIWL